MAEQLKDERGSGTRFASDSIHAPVGPAARCSARPSSVPRAPARFAETVSEAREGFGSRSAGTRKPRLPSRQADAAERLLGTTFDLGETRASGPSVPITGSPATERGGDGRVFSFLFSRVRLVPQGHGVAGRTSPKLHLGRPCA